MKTSIIVYALLFLSTSILAQVYKAELDGKYLPVSIIFGNSTVQDMQMMYQQPEFFKNPQNKFRLAKADGSEAYEHSGGIEAFMIDNMVWLLRPVKGQNQFVIVKQQGAIEQFEYIINGALGEVSTGAYVVTGERTKTLLYNTLKSEMIEGDISLDKLREWIADAPEVVEDMEKELAANELQKAATASPKKGLMGNLEKAAAKEAEMKKGDAGIDVNRIINNYNVSYEQRNAGSMKYYFVSPPTWINRTKSQTEAKADKDANLDKLFANRPSSVAREYMSAKDNIPVKKETFGSKLARILSDGNKVGVVLLVKPARTPQNESNAVQLPGQVYVEGEFIDETLKEVGQDLVEELNQTYSTSAVELIDLNNIPYRDVKIMGQSTRIDDYWATKYKVVFAYTVDPRLEVSAGNSKYSVTLNVLQSLVVTEYIGEPTSVKQDILAQILNMGGFRTLTYSQEAEMKDPREIYERALTKLDMPLTAKIKSERKEGMARLVKRLAP